jgi:RecJ-like exonuclease
MKKSHGPAFRKELKPLMECPTCRGAGVVSGVFHQLDCTACHGSGWVCQSTGEALPLEVLVPQLNMKLRNMAAELNRARHSQGGAHEQYEQNNRRGAGGTNYTGD